MMIPRSKYALTVLAALCLGTLGWAFFKPQGTPSKLVYDSKEGLISVPGNATQQDYNNLLKNYATGSSLTTAITITSNEGEVSATLTGIVMVGTGERQLSISVLDEENDLLEARAYVNGTELTKATVANGGIVVRSGKAIAGLTILVPPSGQLFTVEVRWDDSSGHTRTHWLNTAL